MITFDDAHCHFFNLIGTYLQISAYSEKSISVLPPSMELTVFGGTSRMVSTVCLTSLSELRIWLTFYYDQILNTDALNLSATITYDPPGSCPPFWPSGLFIKWTCSWMGQECNEFWNGMPINWTNVSSTFIESFPIRSMALLGPGTFEPSNLPYIVTITVFLQVEDGYPLLQTQQRLYVSPTYPVESSKDAVKSRRRILLSSAIDSESGPLLSAVLNSLGAHRHITQKNYVAFLREYASGEFIPLEISSTTAPTGGFCSGFWDSSVLVGRASGLPGLFGLRFDCRDWVGGDEDSYPLSYNFGLIYR